MRISESFPQLQQHIKAILQELSVKLAIPDHVHATCSAEDNHTDLQANTKWDEISLASGYPAVGLLYGRLASILHDESFNEIAHQYLVKTREALKTKETIPLSLWSGLTGIGFTAYLLSGKGKYQKFIQQINQLIILHGDSNLKKAIHNVNEGVSFHDYDVITGWSGIGRYLLLFNHVPEARNLLTDALNYLVSLSKDKMLNDQIVPGWYIPVHHLPPHEQQRFPNGYFNMGLAHGIPGPLSLLSLAWDQNVRVEGHQEAIEKYSSWILHWKQQDANGWYWPMSISYEEYLDDTLRYQTDREAWCYGSPGVARSLWLAGRVLEDRDMQTLAVDSFKRIYTRPPEEWSIYSPTVCHGYSGLLKLTYQMYLDTGDEELRRNGQDLLHKIEGMFNNNAAFGFCDIVKDTRSTKYLDYVGLLDGVAGIAMTLSDMLDGESKRIGWGAALLIS